MLEEVANCVPALTPLVAKCCGTGPADVFFRMDPGVQLGDPMGPAMFCVALRPRLERFPQKSEGEGV